MGCITSKCYKNNDLKSSSPFDNILESNGPTAPYLDKLKYNVIGYVVSVYDGDTFTIAVKHCTPDNLQKNKKSYELQVVKVKCRIHGIDTPEMKPPKNQPNRDAEKAKALEAKQFVETIILHKYIKISVDGHDKYGRWLVKVTCPDTGHDLAEMLLKKGHAYRYDGGTKQAFKE